jgi:hypothetical protein
MHPNEVKKTIGLGMPCINKVSRLKAGAAEGFREETAWEQREEVTRN